MGKTRCSICNHKDRKEIEKHLLVGDLSLRSIGHQYGVSHSPLFRHKQNCMNDAVYDVLPPEIPAQKEIEKRPNSFMTGEEILGELHSLIGEAKIVMNEAKSGENKNPNHVLMAIDRINKVTQTYVSFMDIAKTHESDSDLQDWREIGAAIWAFIDSKGLRNEFEAELSRRGI